jgi:hypothetical protein
VDTSKYAGVGAKIGEVACIRVEDGEGFIVGDRDNPRIRAKDKDAQSFFKATWRDYILVLGITREYTPMKE